MIDKQVDAVFSPTRTCLGCGVQTLGSVGAAGYRWSSICQPCKDKADNEAADGMRRLARSFDAIFEQGSELGTRR